jgi:cysteinyl-tRNA synthetase
MDYQFYDTYSNTKKLFTPLDALNVRMYVCGPTVYDYAHVGNARPVIVFDIVYRMLQFKYGSDHVTYVRNITDVDDKIIEASNSLNEDISTLTNRTIDYFHDDADYVGALQPNVEPKATDHILEMIDIIEKLIEKNHAYEADGNVLFAVNTFDNYGNLSGKSLEDLIAGSRVEVADYKKNPADFILWKPSKANEPGWGSPWGKGRPGWHIECSAMSEKYLGQSFDIHGGGQDLTFPHHENEIAQSESCNNKKFANFWMHNGFLSIEGEKMSKSLGNFITINELKDKYQGEVIRFNMMLTHYRQPLNWTEKSLQDSKKTLDKWYKILGACNKSIASKNELISNKMLNALADDVNTPQAIAELHQLYKAANDGDIEALEIFYNSCQFLGILISDYSSWSSWQSKIIDIDENLINELIEKRNEARRAKDFAEADRIRDELLNLSVILEDKDNETTWKLK